MLARQRHAYILDRVRADGGVRVADLVRELDVSDMTIRRDLELLHEQGLLEKVHGGATTVPAEHPVRARVHGQGDAPAGRQGGSSRRRRPRWSPRVRPSRISAGTTTYAVARRLLDVPRLTVVTNSVPVADVLYHGGRADQTVILTGGVRTPSDALAGPFAVAALRTVNVDLVLMGVHGMDPRAGFTTPNMLEAETDRALVEAGRRLVVVADHTKWGVIGVSTIARFCAGGPAHLRSGALGRGTGGARAGGPGAAHRGRGAAGRQRGRVARATAPAASRGERRPGAGTRRRGVRRWPGASASAV